MATLAAGTPADFLLLPAQTLGEAIVTRPLQRQVFKTGRLIAANGRLLQSRL